MAEDMEHNNENSTVKKEEEKEKERERRTDARPSVWPILLAMVFGASLHWAVAEYQLRVSLSIPLDSAYTDHLPPQRTKGTTIDAISSQSQGTDLPTKRAPGAATNKDRAVPRPNGRPLGWPGQHRTTSEATPLDEALQPLPVKWPVEEEASLFRELVGATSTLDWAPVVAKQLAQWKDTGYTQSQVDEYCVKKVVVASFVNNELRAWNFRPDRKNMHRLHCGFWLIKAAVLRAAARGNPMPDFEVAVLSGDSAFSLATPRLHWDDAGPLLSNIKCGDASVSFPMTLSDMFGGGDGTMSLSLYAEKFAKALDWSGDTPWETLENVAFFSAGGGATTRGNRSHLFAISKAHSNYLNATPHARGMDVMSDFRYNVYAYGHCGWSRRIKELAMLRTVVLLEESSCAEYVHGMFQPDVDHMPVSEDFADLVAKMEAATLAGGDGGTPFDGNAMAEEWVTRGQEMMTLTSTLDYVELLLRELAKLQKFVPQPHPEWKEYTLSSGRLFFHNLAKFDDRLCAGPKFRAQPRSHKC